MYAFHMDVPQPLAMYEAVMSELRAAGEHLPAARLLQLCVPNETGFRITEIWESHEAADRYGDEVLLPTIEKIAGAEATAGGPPPNEEFSVAGLQVGGRQVVP